MHFDPVTLLLTTSWKESKEHAKNTHIEYKRKIFLKNQGFLIKDWLHKLWYNYTK